MFFSLAHEQGPTPSARNMDEARLYGREVTSDVPSSYPTDLRTPQGSDELVDADIGDWARLARAERTPGPVLPGATGAGTPRVRVRRMMSPSATASMAARVAPPAKTASRRKRLLLVRRQ